MKIPILLACFAMTALQGTAQSTTPHTVPELHHLPAAKTPAKPAGKAELPLDERERATQMLSRFTFGIRPGDVEQVMAVGSDQWFEAQLHPQQIDNAVLDKRLAQYPTLGMQPAALHELFPDGAVIRRIAENKQPYPADPLLAGMYEVMVARELKQQETDKANAAGKPAPQPADAEKAAQHQQDQGAALQVFAELLPVAASQRMVAIMRLPLARRLALTQPGALPDAEKNRLLAGLPPREKEMFSAMGGRGGAGVVINETQQAKVLRAILSERQLQEVMTDFWFNHFNVFIDKSGNEPYYVEGYERDVIRPLALGKFRDLLLATARHPAMLEYLDNASSIGPDSVAAGGNKPGQKKNGKGLNENYARELMELHTVGVNGGYSQADVTSLAKILTGWTIDHPELGGGFTFDPKRHEPGAKHWFGHTVPFVANGVAADGVDEGKQALEWLASRPQTAHFVSYKLAQRFVADTPPAALVDRMAKTFLSSDGDITAVLETMAHSPEFDSRKYFRNKVKTPLEFVASTIRATATDPTNPGALAAVIAKMGEPLYRQQPPTGYPMTAENWMNSAALVDRLNFSLSLTGGKMGGIPFDAQHVLALGLLTRPAAAAKQPRPAGMRNGRVSEGPAKPVKIAESGEAETVRQPGSSGEDEALALVEQTLIGTEISAKTKAVLMTEADRLMAQGKIPANAADSLNTVTALVLGSPEFQLR